MEIKISFINPNINAEGIRVYRDTKPMDPAALPAPIATIAGNVNSYSDTTVVKDASYFYIFEVFSGTEKVRSGNISATATFYSGPGNQTLLAGDLNMGYYGLISPNDFVDWNAINDFAGLTVGTRSTTELQNWFKFAYKGKILFVPRQPIAGAGGLNWSVLYTAGLVYGVDGIGPREFNTQTAVNQLRTIAIGGSLFKIRLMRALPLNADFTKSYTTNTGSTAAYTGSTPESFDSTFDLTGSEWNDLFMKIMRWTPTSQRGENWDHYDAGDLGFNTSTTGMSISSIMMERSGASITPVRGLLSGSTYHPGYAVTQSPSVPSGTAAMYWRPVLEMI
jgi:hypothetical protein